MADVRKIDSELRSLVDSWVLKHKEMHTDLTVVPSQILTNGYVAFAGDVPAVATFVYSDNVICWYAWTTANPDVRGKDRDQAFKDLFEYTDKLMKDNGVLCAFAAVTNSSLLKRFYDEGFLVANYDNVHMLKPL